MSAKNSVSSVYEETHLLTRLEILALTGLTEDVLEDSATELSVDYEVFCMDYRGPDLGNPFRGFQEMLRQWGAPWPEVDESSLNALTLPQYFLAWAWRENDSAKYCLDGKALAFKEGGWTPTSALSCGVIAATTAQKAIAHAKLLMAGGKNIAAFTTTRINRRVLINLEAFEAWVQSRRAHLSTRPRP